MMRKIKRSLPQKSLGPDRRTPTPRTIGTATVLQCAFKRKPITEMVPHLMETIGAPNDHRCCLIASAAKFGFVWRMALP